MTIVRPVVKVKQLLMQIEARNQLEICRLTWKIGMGGMYYLILNHNFRIQAKSPLVESVLHLI